MQSEYYEPKKLPGERAYPQIILDAEKLYALLLQAETMMTKVDRIRYGNRAVDQILEVIKEFTLAYDFEDDREIHLKRMCANVAVFIRTMRIIGERNVICVRNPLDATKPDTVKLQIIERLAKIGRGRDPLEEIHNSKIKEQGHVRHRVTMTRQSRRIIKETLLPVKGS